MLAFSAQAFLIFTHHFPIDAISASISAWLNILPGSAAAGAAAGAPAAGTLAGEKPPPPPACDDLPIILASNSCCSALSPFASINYLSRLPLLCNAHISMFKVIVYSIKIFVK